ncbi:MAG: VOC family protein [Chloroflexi bacterium]|nr:VOC family protein [Chloroflexota bacterium]
MVLNRSRPSGIIPTLYYEDVGAAIDWLFRVFGFIERFRYGPPDRPEGAQLSAGGGAIMLSIARKGQSPAWEDSGELRPPRAGEVNVIISVQVEDIDQVFEQARHFGARIIHGPETYSFGERQFTAEDFAGYRWSFSQSVDDVAPEDWGAAVPRQ